MRPRNLGALLLATLILIAAGCSGQIVTAAQPAIVIGAVYPVTGPQADGGKQEYNGVRAALEVANRTGAFGARSVVLKLAPAETPGGAVQAVDRLIDQDHVSIIIGTYGSTLSEAAAARADERRTVYWETGAVSDGVTRNKRYVFRTVSTGSNLGRTAVEFTSKVLMPAAHLQPAQVRVVIVHVADVYGTSVASGEVARAQQLGIRVVDKIGYDPNNFDPVGLAAQIGRAKADYLWDVSYLEDGVALWTAVIAQQIPLKAAVGTSSAWCMPEFGKRLGASAIGVYAADKPDDGISPMVLDPDGRSLLAQARGAYALLTGQHSMPIPAVAGFVGGWSLFNDVLPKVTGPLTADSVREVAFKVDVPYGRTINGGGVQFALADVGNGGQNRRAAAVVGQWQGVNEMRVVYPPGYAQADPIFSP